MLDAVNILTDVYYSAFQGFCLQYFLGSFLEYREQKRRFNGLAVAAVYTIFSLCIGKLLPYGYGDIRIIEKQAVTIGMIVLLVLFFYRAGKAITGYLIITFMAVSQLGFYIAYSTLQVSNKLYDVWVLCVEKGYIVDDSTITIILHATTIGLMIWMYGVYSGLCIYFLKGVVRRFQEKDYPVNRTELYFLLAPSMAGFLICMLLQVLVVTVENGVPKLLYDRHPVLTVFIPAILLLCLLSILYSVKLFQDMISLNRERNSRVILERQISSMQGQIAEMEHIHSGIRSIKHDMKNTLAVIMRFAGQDGGNSGLQSYLSELNQTFSRLEMRYQTGNAVVDTLLNMKYHELIHTMPEVKIDADKLLFPENLMIQSYDMGVIIGNALDNAAEACKNMKGGDREAFIRLSSFSKGRLFFIKVENSFDGKVVRKKGAEFPATDKPDKKTHGIGLANIKSTAEKYHGGVDWQAGNRVFTLTVMLKNERSAENEYW